MITRGLLSVCLTTVTTESLEQHVCNVRTPTAYTSVLKSQCACEFAKGAAGQYIANYGDDCSALWLCLGDRSPVDEEHREAISTIIVALTIGTMVCCRRWGQTVESTFAHTQWYIAYLSHTSQSYIAHLSHASQKIRSPTLTHNSVGTP